MQKIYDFNYDWQFFEQGTREMTAKDWHGVGERVTIPHTPRIEPLDVLKPFMGVMYYRKTFKIPEELASKVLFIDFEGVMTKAVVYLNGKKLMTHYGGYLPFSVDITKHIKMNENNVLVVEVDNRDDSTIPPGKATSDVDFLYFGGIYRNVSLRAVDKVYIDKPVTKRGGGVLVYTDKVEDNTAYLSAYVSVTNRDYKNRRVLVKNYILDSDHTKVTEVESKSEVITAGGTFKFASKIIVRDPILWDTENPYLYTLNSEVYVDGELIDEVYTTIGIRTVRVDTEGFYLNDKLVRLSGANRHQQFPYVGIAGSDNADRRDMRMLKDAGFNIVRLSHYPQSDALMDECDRLGLMVIVCTPGWQFCRPGIFKRRVIENLRDMVRKDRNHASAVIWEASLNETGWWWMGSSDRFFRKCVSTVRAEFAPHPVLVCGDTIGRKHWKSIGYDIPFTGWDNSIKIRVLDSDIKGITREYGDYEMGGHNSTTRVAIREGEMPMRIQAFNFQWSHNMNLGSPYELGDLIWEGFDHNRGMGQNKPTSTSGILNEWRVPKYSYYFFKSQRDDEDMVYIPTYWDGETNGKLTVYSNAEEVELLINGQKIARQRPNDGETHLFVADEVQSENSVDYWQKGGEYDINNAAFDLAKFVYSKFDGAGDCEHLTHAPFTFDVHYEAGEVEARAYRDGKVVASHIVRTPGEDKALVISVDYAGHRLLADGRDKIFVHISMVDDKGTVCKCTTDKVELSASGATIIGNKCVPFEAGVASALVMADRGAESVVITAVSGDKVATASIDLDQLPEDRQYL